MSLTISLDFTLSTFLTFSKLFLFSFLFLLLLVSGLLFFFSVATVGVVTGPSVLPLGFDTFTFLGDSYFTCGLAFDSFVFVLVDFSFVTFKRSTDRPEDELLLLSGLLSLFSLELRPL